MDPAVYQQVLLTVQVSHSQAASAADRAAAYAFCERFNSPEDCAMYAVTIFREPRGDGPAVAAAPLSNSSSPTSRSDGPSSCWNCCSFDKRKARSK
ncbi:Exportin-5-like protein [Phytophthora palmivora]|uniref:Exportin-5-like protein n=1 Tax=Phytophthora palmivora TaxID=4796 RepID=A0A2P4Y7A3_9STRA|nr:Exportin-5-like protein [Phytophthora palmivora]